MCLNMFCKKVVKEENVHNTNIRAIIDELDTLKRENTLLNLTSQNQVEKISEIKENLETSKAELSVKNSEVESKLKEIEFKGKDLLNAEKNMNMLKVNNKKFMLLKSQLTERFSKKSKDAKEIANSIESEKISLQQSLLAVSTKNHKLNQEFDHLCAKLSGLEESLCQKIKLQKSVHCTNQLFKKSATKLQNLMSSIQDITPSKKRWDSICPNIKHTDYNTPHKSASRKLEMCLNSSIKKSIHKTTPNYYNPEPTSPQLSDDIILDEIENNYKIIEKDKIIEQLRCTKDRIFKESTYKDEKTSELTIHLKCFKKTEEEIGVETMDETKNLMSGMGCDDGLSFRGESGRSGTGCKDKEFFKNWFNRSDYSLDYGMQESEMSELNASDLGTNFGCGGDIMGVDLDYELDWGVKRLKVDGLGRGSEKGDLKYELRYTRNRQKMLEDCLNVKRCHESYFYKRNNELFVKKNGIEDDSLIPALDYFST